MLENALTVQIELPVSLNALWQCFTQAEHIVNWNFAHESWHCPKAEVDFKVGGRFSYRMEAKDGSFGFDLNGVFEQIDFEKYILFSLEDARQVEVKFSSDAKNAYLVEHFQPENQNALEQQQMGWQMILYNLKAYAIRQFAA